MALTRAKKEETVDKLKEIMNKARSVTFVNFKGLNVEKANQARKHLKDQNVGYLVAKKTLIKRALDEVGISGEMPALEGEIALAYSEEDLTASAREVYGFQKKESGVLTIAGGIFEGSYRDAEKMTEIASIPSRPVLYGQFVNLINSPLQGLVIALGRIAEERERTSA